MRHPRFPFAHPQLVAALPFALLLTLIAAPVAARPAVRGDRRAERGQCSEVR